MQCRRCGATMILPRRGPRYCSPECLQAARRGSQRRKPPTKRRRLQVAGGWRPSRRPQLSKTGCGRTRSYRHPSGRYRIDHYLGYAELPFVALRVEGRFGEIIARFATLAQAQAACEQLLTSGRLKRKLADLIVK